MRAKSIIIYTEAGEDIGRGHVVRMGHLYRVLTQKGHLVEINTNKAGMEYYNKVGIPAVVNISATGQKLLKPANISIVDIMVNKDSLLEQLRRHTDKLVVVVGAGWTITPLTRWIADLVIYQTTETSELESWVPGEQILLGEQYIMMDPTYSDVDVDDVRLYDLAFYFGGGLNKHLVDPLREELLERYSSLELGGQHWDYFNIVNNLRDAKIYIGSMGMMAYEAITTRTFPIVFCRSEDHKKDAQRLERKGLLTSFGEVSRPTKEASLDNIIEIIDHVLKNINNNYDQRWSPPGYKLLDFDGKGIYRVALEVLRV
jgi:spore coat polysaccharide biosynthesis predicted glycosyltransferase SpsG